MRAPLFLARRAYRRRRLIDAVRLLPLLGMFLFFIPILWTPQDTMAADTGFCGVYLFVVWMALIITTAILSRVLDRDENADETLEAVTDTAGWRG